MHGSYRLAVDFGTTNTTAALCRDGGTPQPLRLGAAANAIPSAVLLYEGRLVVGDEATRLAALDPAAFERTPKRRLGQPTMLLGAGPMDPAALVGAVLGHVVSTARAQSRGTDPEHLVVTHPQAWGPHLLGELRRATWMAGSAVDGVELLSEPIAAASAYRHVLDGARRQRVAVADFGGGTFDVALLESRPGAGEDGLRIVDAAGLDPLGGDDFDSLLEEWVFAQLRAEGGGDLVEQLHSPEHLGARLTLREELRRAKHALSHHASAPLLVTVGTERRVITVTAPEFEAMVRPSVERALGATRRLLGQAGVDHLFLTGGSSLIPLVQREFQRLTDGRVGTLGDPKEVTSVGALNAPSRTTPATPPHAAPPPPAAPAPHPDPAVTPPPPAPAPTPPPAPAPARTSSADRLVTTVRWSLFVVATASYVLCVAFLGNIEALGVPLLVVTPIASVAGSVVYFRWFARERVRSGEEASATPAAIAGWWLPVANLHLAGRSTRRLVVAAGLDRSARLRVSWWWALWVTFQLCFPLTLVLGATDPDLPDGVFLVLGFLFSAALGTAALVMASLVRDVSAALDHRATDGETHG